MTSTYTYDAQSRLASVTASGGISASLKYDALGRLYEVTKAGSPARFLYSGDEIIAEYDGAGLKSRYVRGPNPDEVLVEYAGSGTTNKTWLIADERGSIVAGANSSGVKTFINTYDEYGKPGASNLGFGRKSIHRIDF